jgi:hypothetical protein
MSLRSPSGAPPPATVEIDGRRIDLTALADDICRRYGAEYPDERERYGAAGSDWCRHDNQWLLSWAVDDTRGATDLCEQACWLARVLHARSFPVSRLAHNLRLAAGRAAEGAFGDASDAVAARLSAAAATVDALDLGAGAEAPPDLAPPI